MAGEGAGGTNNAEPCRAEGAEAPCLLMASALVTKIEKGSPAEKAGLKAGDVITALNDRKVTSSSSLPMLVSSLRPGTKAELTVIRDKKEIKLDITIGTNSAADNSASSADTHRLGIEARVLTDAESKDAGTTGLLITKVS